jgi:hypothetical protein
MDDSVTRRDVLAGVGTAGTIGMLGTGLVGRACGQSTPVTVATRNCYLGADLFRLLAAAKAGGDALRTAVSDLVTAVDRSHPGARMGAIADELARTAPALVGIQEAALVRTGDPGGGTTPTAARVRYDFRDLLLSALDSRGPTYRVVAATENADFELPATVDGERRAVRLTDHDLLLAREDVTTGDPDTGSFDATLSLTQDDRTIRIDRGYGVVDATVGGRSLTVCNTHLESAAAGTRTAQAAELRDLLADRADPVVLVGDLNSGPGASTAAYDRLTASFDDVAGTAGGTCCHAADLRNADPSLDSRIDHVFVRGALRASDVTRIGAAPDARIAADGEHLWPSDHAGVVATLVPEERTATATPTQTPRSTATPTRTRTRTPTAGSGPGFGVAAAVAALLGGGLAARGDDD